MYDLDYLRRTEFHDLNDTVYLNNAGIAPLPQRTQHAVREATRQLSVQPNRFWEMEAVPTALALNESLARHINADSPSEIVFVTTTSMAINLVAQAFEWHPGDNILLSEVEFPSNAYPWLSLVRDGVEVRRLPVLNGGLTVEAVESFTDENTRLIAASSVQFFSGHRTDLKSIGTFCHDHGIIFAVDAIQSIGHIGIDVQAMHIDILATGGQKSLLALPGTGFMYVRQALADRLNPRIISSNGTKDFLHWLHYDLTPLPGAARFNTGTPNLLGIFSIAASLELMNELTLEAIDSHTRELSIDAHQQLEGHGLEVITPIDAIGPIVTFRSPLPVDDTDTLVRRLAEREVVVVKHLDAGGNPYIRLSFHCYNTLEEIDRFLEIFQTETRRLAMPVATRR